MTAGTKQALSGEQEAHSLVHNTYDFTMKWTWYNQGDARGDCQNQALLSSWVQSLSEALKTQIYRH